MNTPNTWLPCYFNSIQERSRKLEIKFAERKTALASTIFDIILSKKFRKYSVSDTYKSEIKAAIELNISRQTPIQLAFPYGGYKLWRLDEAPEPDWAELFSLAYYAEWLMPITSLYKPGVWFDFSSSDINVEYANNIPRADLDCYAQRFESLLEFIKPHIPANFKFTFTRVRSRYEKEEFEKELAKKMAELKSSYKDGIPDLTEKEKNAIELNVKLPTEKTIDPLWREKNKLLYDAYHEMSKVRPYYRAPGKIVVSTTSGRASVPMGTSKNSIVKFQVGVGVLERQNATFVPRILSPNQLRDQKFEWENVTTCNIPGKNFRRIRILKPHYTHDK